VIVGAHAQLPFVHAPPPGHGVSVEGYEQLPFEHVPGDPKVRSVVAPTHWGRGAGPHNTPVQLSPASTGQQPPAHGVYPPLHSVPHFAAAHVAVPFGVPGHALPHFEQFAVLVVRSTQEPPQLVKGPLQDDAQALSLHTSAAEHAFVHEPQWS
jgi:hypothetical protein